MNYDNDDDQNQWLDHMEILKENPNDPTPLSVYIGALVGSLVGLFLFMYVEPYREYAFFIGVVTTLVTTTILHFIGKYFFALCIIAYVFFGILGC